MRKDRFWPLAALLAFILLTTPGCELIVDIFQAGLWVGIILVVIVIAVVVWLFRMLTGRRRRT